MHATIYKPVKSAMQSGRGAKGWVLEYEPETPRKIEPTMGWTASADTLNQVRLRFDSKDAAVAFAESQGFDVTVAAERPRKVRPRNYLDNFRVRPYEDGSELQDK